MLRLTIFLAGVLLLPGWGLAASSPLVPGAKKNGPSIATVSQPSAVRAAMAAYTTPAPRRAMPKRKQAAAAKVATPRTEQFRYDANGNVIEHITFNGDSIVREYDVMDREVVRRYPDGSEIQFTYTPMGLVETMTDYRGTTHFEYTARDDLRRVDYPNGQWIEYEYDPARRRTGMITPYQRVDYSYDAVNRLETVADQHGVTSYTYDAVGNRTGAEFPNGTTTSYEYDTLNRLTRLIHKDATGTVLLGLTYVLGPTGNRLEVIEDTGKRVRYEYDGVYRLVLAHTIAGTSERSIAWRYDKVGNRVAEFNCDHAPPCNDTNGTITTYQYTAADELLAVDGPDGLVEYFYDGNGNVIEKAINGVTEVVYGWDVENRLMAANGPAVNLAYEYDAYGIRQAKIDSGFRTDYLVDPQQRFAQVVAETNGGGDSKVIYTIGDDRISREVLAAGQSAGEGNVSFLHKDGLDSTRVLTDETGFPTDFYDYTPFGALEAHSGHSENVFLFAGEQLDPNLGFYYLRARYFDPASGQFTAMDPFEGYQHDPKSLHKYVYAHADPVNNTDPSGEAVSVAQFAVASALLGTVLAAAQSPYSPFNTPAGHRLVADLDLGENQGIGDVIIACTKEHYDLDDVAIRTIVGAGAFPLYKPLIGFPVIGNASGWTNPISVFGHYFFRDAKLPFRFLGTRRAFAAAGRVNVGAAAGFGAYDLTSIGLCITHHL